MLATMRAFLALLEKHGILAGPSWANWRAILIAGMGEPLTPQEAAIFRQFTGFEYEPRLWPLIALFLGRRAGKNSATAVLAVYLALCRPWRLSAGEMGVVLLLAADRTQAKKVAFAYIAGLLEAVPALAAEVVNTTADTINLRNRVEIQVATSDYGSVRGRTVLAAILDEYAFWGSEQATEVVRALRPALATQPEARLVVTTTIYGTSGAAFEIFKRWGQPSINELVVRATTRDFNPSISQAFIDAELASDPLAAAAEYLTVPRSDIAAFVDAQLVDSVTRTEPRELPYRAATATGTTITYKAGVDCSGGRGDATAAAIAHTEGDRVIVDACRRWPAPHDPAVVAREVREFLALYRLDTAQADNYAAELSRTIYRDAGVTLTSTDADRSTLYARLLPLLTTGVAELPPNPQLRTELLGLERKTTRTREVIDHRAGAHDDLINATAIAAVAVSRGSGREVSADEIWVLRGQAADALDNYARDTGFGREPYHTP